MTTTTQNLTWEDVLARVEADVRTTEVALAAAKAGTETVTPRALAPAETMLPTDVAGGVGLTAPAPYLPPLATMPPVPSDLLDRIVELRKRIEALRVKMQAEMLELQAATARINSRRPVAAIATASPRFVDRAL